MKPKVLVYLQEEKLVPHGGPLAVGYYYRKEMNKRNENIFCFIQKEQKVEVRWLRKIILKLPRSINKVQRFFRGVFYFRRLLKGKIYAKKRDFSEYDIIHFHQSMDLFLERYNLENYRGAVILQSHSPLPYSLERMTDLSPLYRLFIPGFADKFLGIDKYAFERADHIIFPCEDAEEPYLNNWKDYARIKSLKQNTYHYILTGIESVSIKKERKQILQELNIQEADHGFIISYVGRHNFVKGYDLLKSIFSRYIELNENSWLIAAGKEEPFVRLNHKHWIEVGFTTDPYSYIAASDVFVLPNRVTYFDIVMIEVLSLGKIVIASRTGGNKFFEKCGLGGVLLYDSEEEAVLLLDKVCKMTTSERRVLEEENKLFFEKYLTASAMYNSYISVLRSISE